MSGLPPYPVPTIGEKLQAIQDAAEARLVAYSAQILSVLNLTLTIGDRKALHAIPYEHIATLISDLNSHAKSSPKLQFIRTFISTVFGWGIQSKTWAASATELLVSTFNGIDPSIADASFLRWHHGSRLMGPELFKFLLQRHIEDHDMNDSTVPGYLMLVSRLFDAGMLNLAFMHGEIAYFIQETEHGDKWFELTVEALVVAGRGLDAGEGKEKVDGYLKRLGVMAKGEGRYWGVILLGLMEMRKAGWKLPDVL